MPKSKLHPETRTVRKLQADGWVLVGKVATRMGKFASDLFGFADVIGIRSVAGHGIEVILVQATSASNVSARVKKLDALDSVGLAVGLGITVEVWGWYPEKDEPRVVSFNTTKHS